MAFEFIITGTVSSVGKTRTFGTNGSSVSLGIEYKNNKKKIVKKFIALNLSNGIVPVSAGDAVYIRGIIASYKKDDGIWSDAYNGHFCDVIVGGNAASSNVESNGNIAYNSKSDNDDIPY